MIEVRTDRSWRQKNQLLDGRGLLERKRQILVALFGTETNVGLVRIRFDELRREAEEVGWAAGSAARDAAGFEADLASGLRRDAGGDG